MWPTPIGCEKLYIHGLGLARVTRPPSEVQLNGLGGTDRVPTPTLPRQGGMHPSSPMPAASSHGTQATSPLPFEQGTSTATLCLLPAAA
eukprot:2771616-Amphidinium_carterae.1